jgi:hypothetical protein
MTKKEISTTFDIPLSTLNDWDKRKNRKHSLLQFLKNISLEEIDKFSKSKKSHRLLHILNRNIDKDRHFTYDEIKNAFSQTNYKDATQREKIIYSKFFKECDTDDLEDLEKVFHISKRDVKSIYKQIPERSFKGVSEVWDKRFRLKALDTEILQLSNNIPSALQAILQKRTTNV